MRTFTSVVSDMPPGVVECLRQEYRISSETFSEKAKVINPNLDDDAVGILHDEFAAEAAARLGG